MKKQFTLNLDALVAIVIVFAMACSFMFYQRYQYADLLEEHVQLQWEVQDIKINVNYCGAMLAQCKASK